MFWKLVPHGKCPIEVYQQKKKNLIADSYFFSIYCEKKKTNAVKCLNFVLMPYKVIEQSLSKKKKNTQVD